MFPKKIIQNMEKKPEDIYQCYLFFKIRHNMNI